MLPDTAHILVGCTVCPIRLDALKTTRGKLSCRLTVELETEQQAREDAASNQQEMLATIANLQVQLQEVRAAALHTLCLAC